MTTFYEARAVAALMADFDQPWAFCGGWAIDLFLDRRTRHHKDIDVAIARRDQVGLQAYLVARGWGLQIAHDGTLTDWSTAEYVELPRHGIWCRHLSADPDFLEVLLNEIDAETFRFRRDQTVTRPLDRAFIRAPSGLPILAPEIVLLYKSSSLDRTTGPTSELSCPPSTRHGAPGSGRHWPGRPCPTPGSPSSTRPLPDPTVSRTPAP